MQTRFTYSHEYYGTIMGLKQPNNVVHSSIFVLIALWYFPMLYVIKRLYGANIGHRKRVLYIRQYKYADKDIKKLIGSIVVLVDTREKKNSHIIDYLIKNNIAYEPTTLS